VVVGAAVAFLAASTGLVVVLAGLELSTWLAFFSISRTWSSSSSSFFFQAIISSACLRRRRSFFSRSVRYLKFKQCELGYCAKTDLF